MIKDIVVNLKVGTKNNSASDYAVSVAATLDAHLTGIVFLYGPTMPVSRAGYVPPELEVIEQHNEAAVEAARQSFTAASARAGIKAEPLTLSAALRSSGDRLGQIARCFDVAIVSQAEPQADAVEENIVEAALFNSGGPVIIVPYIQKAALKLDRIMVCWDGSRAAARFAMPSRFCDGRSRRGRHRDERVWQTGPNRTHRYKRAFGSPWSKGSDQADTAW